VTDLYLASRSSRRRDLLKQIGVRFEPLLLRLAQPRGPDIDESLHAGESPAAYAERIAHAKAELGVRVLALRSMLVKPVLAADTIVIIDGEVLGKPADRTESAAFLRRLSGRMHEVRTAVALALGGSNSPRVNVVTSTSQVRMREISDAEITRYCATSEPYDKAGGYAIQGMAAIFIDRIEGSYSGVMGLPLAETAELLKQGGMPVL
jgi:septum formation protein